MDPERENIINIEAQLKYMSLICTHNISIVWMHGVYYKFYMVATYNFVFGTNYHQHLSCFTINKKAVLMKAQYRKNDTNLLILIGDKNVKLKLNSMVV